MSSTFLYLAIVAVWAVVLVPMWLRRDTDASGFSRLLHKRPGQAEEPLPEDRQPPVRPPEPQDLHPDEETLEEELQSPARRRPTRAGVIARRRRRTFGLALLLLASIGVVASGLVPWWTTLPPIGLLAAHLTLLRVAVGMDTARHRAHAAERARARHELRQAERAREAEEAAHQAEIIEFVARARDVFDQYADDRRAVGD